MACLPLPRPLPRARIRVGGAGAGGAETRRLGKGQPLPAPWTRVTWPRPPVPLEQALPEGRDLRPVTENVPGPGCGCGKDVDGSPHTQSAPETPAAARVAGRRRCPCCPESVHPSRRPPTRLTAPPAAPGPQRPGLTPSHRLPLWDLTPRGPRTASQLHTHPWALLTPGGETNWGAQPTRGLCGQEPAVCVHSRWVSSTYIASSVSSGGEKVTRKCVLVLSAPGPPGWACTDGRPPFCPGCPGQMPPPSSRHTPRPTCHSLPSRLSRCPHRPGSPQALSPPPTLPLTFARLGPPPGPLRACSSSKKIPYGHRRLTSYPRHPGSRHADIAARHTGDALDARRSSSRLAPAYAWSFGNLESAGAPGDPFL
ncbi:translation initiation factor IF-2-like [Camelus ferus]|uniref:Translation initiation factor IF-2-like n=1 Tax=Camelus ferus TaxID=419612 RepID=A0A8B8TW22_CAMFR|nr:translation initiation factor IF-2-like [Camelus ferus]XP_032346502.1 translation initiation factor IF-2-like [Camelus ferus]